MDGISVVICCYNSALKLPLVLEKLDAQQTDAALNWEIIIVDNKSIDDTAGVATKYWSKTRSVQKLSVVYESKPGLSFAREKGVEAALYPIIVFCDDDNLLACNYLQYAYNLVCKTYRSGYGIWGGSISAYFDDATIVPKWFEREKLNYVVGKQADKTGDISSRGYLWGAGMVILKELFTRLLNKQFPLLLTGRQKGILLAGDDSELCLRSILMGYGLYYDKNLQLKHYIPQYKLTHEYNENLTKGFSISNSVLNKYKIFIHYAYRKNILIKTYYRCIFIGKHFLNNIRLRTLTDHDRLALQALFIDREFRDLDFAMIRDFIKQKSLKKI